MLKRGEQVQLSREAVADVLEAAGLAGSWTELEPMTNGFTNTVVKISHPEGPLILKIASLDSHPGKMTTEAEVMRFLYAHTDVPVPAVLDYKDGGGGLGYVLMEHVEGIPLNWLFYELPADQRRPIVRQVCQIIIELQRLRVHGRTLGSIAGPFRWDDSETLVCPRGADPVTGLGPFCSVRERYERRFEHFLARLKDVQGGRFRDFVPRFRERRSHLDPAVLDDGEPLCVAHNDICPMNLVVEPRSRVVRAVVDWESATIGLPDDDWHSLLYYWWWKWLDEEDARMTREILRELGHELPLGYGARLTWHVLTDLPRRMGQYHRYFEAEADVRSYERGLMKAVTRFLEGGGS